MPVDAGEIAAKSIARFNVPGRQQPRMGEGSVRGDNEGTVKPRIAKAGYVRFLSLRDLDQRSRAAIRCKELVGALSVDLGGADRLSAAQQQLVQRSALMGTLCEDFEVRFALGEPIELLDYITVANAQRRLLVTLGLQRQARDITKPTLSDYLRERSAPDTDVVVAVNGSQAEPVVEAGLELALDAHGAPAGTITAQDVTRAPEGTEPAATRETSRRRDMQAPGGPGQPEGQQGPGEPGNRTSGQTFGQPEAADRPGNGAAS
jgi:hypothetical protein